MSIGVPVLIITYQGSPRFDECLASVKAHGARDIYVSIDGAQESAGVRKPGRYTVNIETLAHERRVMTIRRRIMDQNLGSRVHCVDAITWFFQNVEEGLILEDDVIIDGQTKIDRSACDFLSKDVFAICLYGGRQRERSTLISSPLFSTWGWIGNRSNWAARNSYCDAPRLLNWRDVFSVLSVWQAIFWWRWLIKNKDNDTPHWDVLTQEYLFSRGLEVLYSQSVVRCIGFHSGAQNNVRPPLNYFKNKALHSVCLDSNMKLEQGSKKYTMDLSWVLHSFPYNLRTLCAAILYKTMRFNTHGH